MGFESWILTKLDRMQVEAKRDLDNALGGLVLEVIDALQEEDWGAFDLDDLGDTIDAVEDAALKLDSVECINFDVLGSKNGSIWDVRVVADFERLRERVRDEFDSGDLPDRSFVYVAWRSRPLQFFYVGKGGRSDRVDITRHGKLSRATSAGNATMLSLVFPGRSDAVDAVESSLITLLEPEMNDQQPRQQPQSEEVWNRITDLKRLLAAIAGRIPD